MTPLKLNRAFALAGITMPTVRAHIERQIEPQIESLKDLTARQLAAVLMLAKFIYHEGRASTKAECLDGTPEDGLYWLGGKDGVAVIMTNSIPTIQ